VTANIGSVVDQSFVIDVDDYDYGYKPTAMGSTEQLFTAAASQRLIMGQHIANRMHLKSVDDQVLLALYNSKGDVDTVAYHRIRTQQWFKQFPYYPLLAIHSEWPPAAVLTPVTAIPRLLAEFDAEPSVEDMWWTALLIQFKTNVIHSDIDRVKNELLRPRCDSVEDYRVAEREVEEARDMLDLIFSLMTYAALCLCLFSLISSMFANIMEQSKEIGIFRSMGLTKFQINKIYIYEALVIIFSSSLLGFCVGYIVSFVIVQQQILFSQYPIQLVVPSSVIFAVISGAVFTSVIAVYFPLTSLNKKQIAQNLRDITL